MQDEPVFLDPSGKRGKWVKALLVASFVAALALVLGFLASLGASKIVQPPKKQPKASFSITKKTKDSLERLTSKLSFANDRLRPPPPLAEQICLGFYAPWEESGIDSLRANASKLTHLSPAWLSLKSDTGELDERDFDLSRNNANQSVIQIAKANGIRLVPLLSNAINEQFDPAVLSRLLKDKPSRQRLIENLVAWCSEHQFQGINFDFEEIRDTDYPLYEQFLTEAAAAFKARQLEISIDVQTSVDPEWLRRWSKPVDYVVAMIYDEHDEYGKEGPIASLNWVKAELSKVLNAVPSDKVVMGIGAYAYDWKDGASSGTSMTYQEAMATAQGYRDGEKPEDVVELDPESLNNRYEYEDDDGTNHTVWFLDSVTAFNQWQLGKHEGIRGAAVWAMGSEDPDLWTFLNKDDLYDDPDPQKLSVVAFPFEVSYTGKGEILKVESRPQQGRRELSITKQKDIVLIDDSVYQSYATPYVIKKSGYQPKKLVLTFDDGPDPNYTPKILDILKQEGVPATFFVVGANAEGHPDLIARAYREGHEIGSHTFFHPDLGLVNKDRVTLELNATQRVIEATTGRSTILFRPPYNADSQPQTEREVTPVSLADEMGYITVGENIDPNDWAPLIDDGGTQRPRTAEDIIRLTVSDIEARKNTAEEGNIILLHDAGGDRTQTVRALPQIIRQLKAKGYEFTTVSGLMGKSVPDVMPAVPAELRPMLNVDLAFFQIVRWGQFLLAWGFVAALALGATRVIFMAVLSLFHRASRKGQTFDPNFRPSVSVLIAAYNEEKTIIGTIESVLGSTYPLTEIIVIDDGSKDGTFAILESTYGGHPVVRPMTKPNGGKASALNLAIEQAKGDLLFCIDADTELDPLAIEKMARHFKDDRLAALAGNVQVGNVKNVLTSWQAVEYRTSQNMDRRALAYLNAITVVPGAIGMWRKSAVQQVGGYETDTLAEDMDLTWRLRMAGYRLETEPEAVAFTEAPESWSNLGKQRLRWSYGTLQCLWKHREATLRYGAFGWFALPTLWLFQIAFQILGPLVDLQILLSLALALAPVIGGHSVEFSAAYTKEGLFQALLLYGAFFALEFGSGLIAYRQDRVSPVPLLWLFVQRFAYRQLMYWVMLKSLWKAFVGVRQGWGKLGRTGNASSTK